MKISGISGFNQPAFRSKAKRQTNQSELRPIEQRLNKSDKLNKGLMSTAILGIMGGSGLLISGINTPRFENSEIEKPLAVETVDKIDNIWTNKSLLKSNYADSYIYSNEPSNTQLLFTKEDDNLRVQGKLDGEDVSFTLADNLDEKFNKMLIGLLLLSLSTFAAKSAKENLEDNKHERFSPLYKDS